jgi:hypothetical protein
LQKSEKQKATVYGYKEIYVSMGDLTFGEEATPTWALLVILSNILLQMFRLLLELLCIRKIKNLAEEWNVF